LDDSCVFSKIAAKFGRELRNADRGYVNVAMSCRLQGGGCIELDSLHERKRGDRVSEETGLGLIGR